MGSIPLGSIGKEKILFMLFTLVGFMIFCYGLAELVKFDFRPKIKRHRRRRLRLRAPKGYLLRLYDAWWPQSLRFFSRRPRKHSYVAQFKARDAINRENRRNQNQWGR